jgi:tRNA threonylcarbamoyladenosine biosynthesis protein TsaE
MGAYEVSGQRPALFATHSPELRRYEGRLRLYHFDAYRLRDAAEMEQIGSAETFASGGVSVVEWADHVAQSLPPEHFMLAITVAGETDRRFRLSASGPAPGRRLGAFRSALAAWCG